jgi:curved DNA-binding protein CbpA
MTVRYSPYEVLGLEANASERQAKRRYQQLIREHTPEHSPEMFNAIREAYEAIKSAGLESGSQFPLYRKPLDWLEAQAPEGGKSLESPKEALSEVFETPFSTAAELRNLLRKVRKNW